MFFNNKCFCNKENIGPEAYDMKDNCGCGPIIEPITERCIQRNICHKVEHVCPIHTRIINNHVIEHTYRPEYTCSEENTVTNIDPGCSGQNF